MRHDLLDLPPYPAEGYGMLADRMATLMGATDDVLWVQAEAIIALEALASSLARPGLRAVNIVTSPYGRLFGGWLRRGGATVTDVVAEPGRPVQAEAVATALRGGADMLAVVHAETASGILNPLEDIAALARADGVLLVVDAVASLGGHPFDMAALGADAVVTGPQKGLGGPAGVSAVALGPRAWAAIDRADAPRDSALSLADLRHKWLDTGRGALPGMPSALEWWALEAALARVEAEGIGAIVHRHGRARTAARAALTALGLPLWVAEERQASAFVTTVMLDAPPDLARAAPALRAAVDHGVGNFPRPVIRFNHTGPRARALAMAEGIVALGDALSLSPDRIDIALEAAGSV
jgi:aspartate aminotransferase-like enzyme